MGIKGFDFKEFGLKYGERVGLGVGLTLMVLLVVWGLLGGGSDLTKDVLAKNGKSADNAIQTNPVDELKLIPPEVIRTERLRDLAEAAKKLIGFETIRLAFPYFVKLPGDDNFRTNPEVYTADQIVSRPVQFAFKIIDVRNGRVLTTENPKNDQRFTPKDNERGKRMRNNLRGGGGGGGYPGMPGGGGGAGAGGAGGSGPSMPGMPGGGGGAGAGAGGGRGAKGPGGSGAAGAGGAGAGAGLGGPGGAGGAGVGGPGDGLAMPGREFWTARWIPVDDVRENHIFANNLWPARATLILASYPHGKQMEEITRALRDPREATLLYRPPNVQRREIVPKGTRMADGTFLAEDMVRMPADRSLKPLAKAPANPVTDAEMDQAGWVTINTGPKGLIASLLNVAVELEQIEDPALRSIVEQTYAMVMKLPKAQRGSYPDFTKDLLKLQETIDKIKEKGKPPPRQRDPRFRDDGFDIFGGDGDKAGAGGGAGAGAGAGAGGSGTEGSVGGAGTGAGAGLGAPGGSRPPPGYPGGAGGAGAGAGAGLGVPGGSRPPGGYPGAPGGGGAGGGTASLGGAGPGAAGGVDGTGATTANEDFKDMSGLIRFLDLDLNTAEAGGRTYEYRLRVVLSNPNFEKPDLVENPDFARERELKGPWSAVTRVTFPNEAYVYPDDRIREARAFSSETHLDRVPVQIHKWLSVANIRGVVEAERVGEWWVDRVLAPRGEYIGLNRLPNPVPPAPPPPQKAPDPSLVALIIWSATNPDPEATNRMGMDALKPDLRTDSLSTRFLLADFDGGQKVSRRAAGKRAFDEDVPAEILVVDADGRMFARTLMKDKEEPERKKRFETWEAWFKKVKDRFDSLRPKDTGKKDSNRPDL